MIQSSILEDEASKNPLDAITKRIPGFSVIFSNFYSTLFDRESLYTSPEFNLLKVRDTLNAESIFRRVVDKYQEQIWKNGWKFTGKSPENVKYIYRRFREIAEVTRIPTDDLFERMSRQLIMYSNCFVVKMRDRKASTGSRREDIGGGKLEPVAGYFPQPAEYMQVKRNKKGVVVAYKLVPENGEKEIEWPAEDVIHIYMHRQEGYSFGTPMIVPVLSDISALRRVEQSANVLVFQHAIPILHFIVGDDNETGTSDEITDLNTKITEMSVYGHLVTTNRVKIDIVGSGKEALDVNNILEYWKTRVYSGLGISSVGLGESDTSNRGTATTVISEFQNTSASFQKRISLAINEFMIKELLAEKGINPLRMTDQQMVTIHLPEIDIDNKIADETHKVYLYEHNAITQDEMRIELGREPISDGDQKQTYNELVAIPKILAGKTIVDGEPIIDPVGSAATNNKLKPRNQHGTKKSPSLSKND